MEKTPTLEEALSGQHGPEFQKFAEDCVANAVDKLADMFAHATMTGGANPAPGLFASGGAVQNRGPFMVGNGDREHFVPVAGMPEPTRIVEYQGTPLRAPVRVKGVIE